MRVDVVSLKNTVFRGILNLIFCTNMFEFPNIASSSLLKNVLPYGANLYPLNVQIATFSIIQ